MNREQKSNEKSLRFDLDIMLLVIRTQIDDKGFQFVTAVLNVPEFTQFVQCFANCLETEHFLLTLESSLISPFT